MLGAVILRTVAMLFGTRLNLKVGSARRRVARWMLGKAHLEEPFEAELSTTMRPSWRAPTLPSPWPLMLSLAHLVGIPPFVRAATTPAGRMASRLAVFLLSGCRLVVEFVAAREFSTVEISFPNLLAMSWPCRGSVRLTSFVLRGGLSMAMSHCADSGTPP